MNKFRAGFTLIELMIVVAIVGILAAIAYPSYRESVLKGRRAEARAALTDLRQQQERYLTQRNTYLAFASGAPTTAAQPFKTYTGDNPTNPLYQIGAAACPGAASDIRNCVELTATPTDNDPAVGNIFIRSSGVKGCSAAAADPAARCWK